jgi:glycosyltransferase involved in cell wall biosynthesis
MTQAGSRPLRVAHVIETLGTGGAEVLLADVTRRLDRTRFLSRVFVLDGPLDLQPRFAAAGVEVDPLLVPPRRRPLACLLALTRRFRRFAPDVVHTHLYYANVLGRIATRFADGPPVVTTLHNPDYTFEARPTALFAAKKALDRFTGRRNAVLLAVSEAVAEDYRRNMGWATIRVIRNGVDVEEYAPGDAPQAGEAWSSAGTRLLAVGRLHAQKGHGVLLEAIARCREHGLALSLALVGEGPLRAGLEEQAHRLGIEGQVQFLGRRDDVRELLRAAEIFVFPSLYEAVGIALLEAMACGAAVVASRAGGIPEIVQDGESGVLVRPGDASDLATALARLARDPPERARLGRGARRRAMMFDIRHTVQELESVYAGLARVVLQ